MRLSGAVCCVRRLTHRALSTQVITNSAEVWKCTAVTLQSAVKLALQLDLCDQLKLRFARVADMVQV